MKWLPKDVIAVVVIVACFALLALGKDSVVTWTLAGVVGAYYGVDLSPWFKIGRRSRKDKEED